MHYLLVSSVLHNEGASCEAALIGKSALKNIITALKEVACSVFNHLFRRTLQCQ